MNLMAILRSLTRGASWAHLFRHARSVNGVHTRPARVGLRSSKLFKCSAIRLKEEGLVFPRSLNRVYMFDGLQVWLVPRLRDGVAGVPVAENTRSTPATS